MQALQRRDIDVSDFKKKLATCTYSRKGWGGQLGQWFIPAEFPDITIF